MLTYKGKDFYLDGEKAENLFRRKYYFRTVPEYWEDRLCNSAAPALTRWKHTPVGICTRKSPANLILTEYSI